MQRLGHIGPHCKAAAPGCSICAKDHAETDHRCPVEGCKVGEGEAEVEMREEEGSGQAAMELGE